LESYRASTRNDLIKIKRRMTFPAVAPALGGAPGMRLTKVNRRSGAA